MYCCAGGSLKDIFYESPRLSSAVDFSQILNLSVPVPLGWPMDFFPTVYRRRIGLVYLSTFVYIFRVAQCASGSTLILEAGTGSVLMSKKLSFRGSK